ncbi:hypothetical protein D9M73_286670 [compost metagenome]
MAGACEHGIARQLGAMQEEQQGDGNVGDPLEGGGHLALGGQQGGGCDYGEQGQGEVVG